jgi:hypothetical protein
LVGTRRHPVTVGIVVEQAKAFREDNQLLSGDVILLNCLSDEHFRNSLLHKLVSGEKAYIGVDISRVPGLNPGVPSSFQQWQRFFLGQDPLCPSVRPIGHAPQNFRKYLFKVTEGHTDSGYFQTTVSQADIFHGCFFGHLRKQLGRGGVIEHAIDDLRRG